MTVVLTPPAIEQVYSYVDSVGAAFAACEVLETETLLALDTETTGLHLYEEARVRLVQIGIPSRKVYIFDLWKIGRAGKAALRELLAPHKGRTILVHNIAFDGPMLLGSGLISRAAIPAQDEDIWFDTMLASQLLAAGLPANRTKGYHSLAGLAKRLLGQTISKEEQLSDWSAPELEERQLRYAALDVALLFPLYSHLQIKLEEARLTRVHRVECCAAFVFGSLNQTGIPVDKGLLDALLVQKQQQAEDALVALVDYVDTHGYPVPRDPDGSYNLRQKGGGRGAARVEAGWNPRSGAQMMAAFRACGVPIPKDPDTGKETLDQRLLAEVRREYELVALYLTYKTAVTRISCCETLLKHYNSTTGRIHANYWQMGADSGRVTSSGPNMQQVPHTADFRGCFRPKPGWKFVVCDYSQIELRLCAAFAHEKRMLEAYQHGEDIHALTAALMNKVPLTEVTKEMRSKAKPVNFGLIYGCGPAALREQAIAGYGVDMTLEEAKQARKDFFEAYSGITAWHQSLKDELGSANTLNRRVRYLTTALGRRRQVLREDDRLTVRANTPIQGSGSDQIKVAMCYLWDHIIRGECELVAMVHDELVLHVPEDSAEDWKKRLSSYMEHAGTVVLNANPRLAQVPILAEAGICDSWAEK